MEKLISGIHHAALKCCGEEKFKETVAFYRDVLGMELLRAWGEGRHGGAMLDTGAGRIEIFVDGKDEPGQGAVRHIALATDDVDACVSAVRTAGYEITREPMDVTIPSQPPFPIRCAFCIGPVGEEIEFFCEK